MITIITTTAGAAAATEPNAVYWTSGLPRQPATGKADGPASPSRPRRTPLTARLDLDSPRHSGSGRRVGSVQMPGASGGLSAAYRVGLPVPVGPLVVGVGLPVGEGLLDEGVGDGDEVDGVAVGDEDEGDGLGVLVCTTGAGLTSCGGRTGAGLGARNRNNAAATTPHTATRPPAAAPPASARRSRAHSLRRR